MKTIDVQKNLVNLGFGSYLRPYGMDGKNGAKTKNAVRVFQKAYNKKFKRKILVDGIAGFQTTNAFKEWSSKCGVKGTKNFRQAEFNNKGAGQKMIKGGMDSKLLMGLELLRYRLNDNAIVINSGYRNPSHNKKVGGAKNSQHLYGKAADIVVKGYKPSTVYNESVKIFDGVGKYPTFTHVDVRGWMARF